MQFEKFNVKNLIYSVWFRRKVEYFVTFLRNYEVSNNFDTKNLGGKNLRRKKSKNLLKFEFERPYLFKRGSIMLKSGIFFYKSTKI